MSSGNERKQIHKLYTAYRPSTINNTCAMDSDNSLSLLDISKTTTFVALSYSVPFDRTECPKIPHHYRKIGYFSVMYACRWVTSKMTEFETNEFDDLPDHLFLNVIEIGALSLCLLV